MICGRNFNESLRYSSLGFCLSLIDVKDVLFLCARATRDYKRNSRILVRGVGPPSNFTGNNRHKIRLV